MHTALRRVLPRLHLAATLLLHRPLLLQLPQQSLLLQLDCAMTDAPPPVESHLSVDDVDSDGTDVLDPDACVQ